MERYDYRPAGLTNSGIIHSTDRLEPTTTLIAAEG